MTRAELISRMHSLQSGDLAVLRSSMERPSEGRGRLVGPYGRLFKAGMLILTPTGYYSRQVSVSKIGRAALYCAVDPTV